MTTDTKAAASRPSVISVLEAARARIAKGWIQGGDRYGDPNAAGCCALGAIRVEAELSGGFWWDVFEDAADTLRAAAAAEFLPEWNDASGRTQAEVLAVFDRAIAVEQGNATEGSP